MKHIAKLILVYIIGFIICSCFLIFFSFLISRLGLLGAILLIGLIMWILGNVLFNDSSKI